MVYLLVFLYLHVHVSNILSVYTCLCVCVCVQELKKKLEKLGLKPVKIKKPLHFQQKVPYCFVTFRSEEEREVHVVKSQSLGLASP